jgi:flagellin-like hook-associated protein FlgL
MDTSQNPPIPRTIRNMPVELKDISDSSDIVRSIVDQLDPMLDHYTGVAVGNPDSTLILLDKRAGDIVINGNEYRAELLSGVHTNFTYEKRYTWVPAADEVISGLQVSLQNVRIYVGSGETEDSDAQYIDIHLPYLTLENLMLDPPQPDFSTPKAAAETLKRAREANNVISAARGILGTDYNRLECAEQALIGAEENVAASYSIIRDADMADLMTQFAKISILTQAQQTSLSHVLDQPQQILSLLT